MELLELYLSARDERRFHAISTHIPPGFDAAETECRLPFWDRTQDWRRTIIKILEGGSEFRSQNFPEAGEQDWMVQEKILRSDCQNYELGKPSYLQRIGEALYRSLFPPDSDTKAALKHSLRLAQQRNVDLHLRLKFAPGSVQRSRVADYPWELLHDGQRFLLHQQVRLSRYIAYEALAPHFDAQEKLRVLLISSRPQGLPQLSLKEQQAIQVGLQRAQDAGLVKLDSLPSPTRKALSIYLANCIPDSVPHVLHFDGHGVFGKRCTKQDCRTIHPGIKAESCTACGQPLPEEQGYLAFETGQGQPDWQSATEVAAFLQPYPLALVVLSACQSGMAVAGESVFNGMAQNLIDQRIPAVVAMQYSVRADAAQDFAEQFYRVLGNRQPILTALNLGIREMGVEGNQWYRPVLYLRWSDAEGGQLFSQPQAQGSSEMESRGQEQLNPFKGANSKLSRFQRLELERFKRDLVDRERDYNTVLQQLRLEGDGPRQNQLKDQLQMLGNEMENLEQQIRELEVGDEV